MIHVLSPALSGYLLFPNCVLIMHTCSAFHFYLLRYLNPIVSHLLCEVSVWYTLNQALGPDIDPNPDPDPNPCFMFLV